MQARIVRHGPDPDPLLRPRSPSFPGNRTGAVGGTGADTKPWRPHQPSQGDFVLIDSLAGGNRPDLAAIAGENPLMVDAPAEPEVSTSDDGRDKEKRKLDAVQLAQKVPDIIDVPHHFNDPSKGSIRTANQGRTRPKLLTSLSTRGETSTSQTGVKTDHIANDPKEHNLNSPPRRTSGNDMPPPSRNGSLNTERHPFQGHTDESSQRSQMARLPALSQFTIPASEGSPNETLPAMHTSTAHSAKSLQSQRNLPGLQEQLGPLADSPLSPESSSRSASSIRTRDPFHTATGTGLPTPLDVSFPRSNAFSLGQPRAALQYPQGLGGQPSPASSTAMSESPREYHLTSPPSRYAPSHSSAPTLQSADLPTPHSADSYSTFSSQLSPNGEEANPEDSQSLYTNGLPLGATFKCDVHGCTALPFQTQYLLNSHATVHSQSRPHYCAVKTCSRSEGGKGFKRKNEMIRHGLVHQSPGYICPFCPQREHKYPRPDNLQRHVRVHHQDKTKDDPQLRDVLAQRAEGISRGRRRRLGS